MNKKEFFMKLEAAYNAGAALYDAFDYISDEEAYDRLTQIDSLDMQKLELSLDDFLYEIEESYDKIKQVLLGE